MIQDKIEELLQPSIESLGYELWACEYLAQGKHSLLRVYIDAEAGIGVADCERVSHQVSAVLDVDDPISGHYSLEVSSPGIPRPLFRPKHYQRFLGSTIHLKLFKPLDGRRSFSGPIVSADDQQVVLELAQGPQSFPFSNVAKAHLTS